jgi:hypothetical protein
MRLSPSHIKLNFLKLSEKLEAHKEGRNWLSSTKALKRYLEREGKKKKMRFWLEASEHVIHISKKLSNAINSPAASARYFFMGLRYQAPLLWLSCKDAGRKR